MVARLTDAEALEQIGALLGVAEQWDSSYLESIADIIGYTNLPHPGDASGEDLTTYLKLAVKHGFDIDREDICAEDNCLEQVDPDEDSLCEYHRAHAESYRSLVGISESEYNALVELEQWQGWRTIVAWVNDGGDCLSLNARDDLNEWARTYGGTE